MLFTVALRSLLRNKRRTAVTLATIAVGASALFIFRGFNTGLLNEYRKNAVHAHYGDGQINTLGYRDKVLAKPWDAWMSEPDIILQQLLKIPGVEKVFPRLEFAALVSNGTRSLGSRGVGINGVAESDFFYTINVVAGQALRAEEDGIVLGKGLAHSLDLAVGSRVTLLTNTIHGTLNGADFRVVGIFHTGSRELDDAFFQIQLPQAQKLMDTEKVEKISLGLANHDLWPQVAAAVQQQFPQIEATPFEVLDKIYYQNSVDFLNAQYLIVRFIILFVVVLGIFNTATSAILERTQEIGMLRANGESKSEILKLIALEGMIGAFLGALLGIIVVFALNQTLLKDGFYMPPGPGITRSFKTYIELQWAMAGEAVGLVLLAGMLGSILAAFKVIRMSISQALRQVG
ncbi:ABC transporter permease [bacterium]|nr:ABC transporter permease [bacterium]